MEMIFATPALILVIPPQDITQHLLNAKTAELTLARRLKSYQVTRAT